MRIEYLAGVAAVLMLVWCSAAADERPSCAADLGVGGQAIAIASPLDDADRIAISNAVHSTLEPPAGAASWPGPQLKTAPPCVLGAFSVSGDNYVLSGASEGLPPRWAQSATNDVVFFLAKGRGGGAPFPRAPAGRLFFLVSIAGAEQFVLTAYDGAPSDATLEADIVASLSPGFTPLASYDPEGDAVDVYRNTSSGVGAQLFGPVPDGERTASMHSPDGHYFTPDRRLDGLMRGSGLACPADLGHVALSRMFVVNGHDEKLDLGCNYGADGINITVFATRSDGRRLAEVFRESVDGAHEDLPGAQAMETLIPVGGKNQFAFGDAWRNEADSNSGLWLGERNGYRIELRADWTSETAKSTGLALSIIQSLAFEKDPSYRR